MRQLYARLLVRIGTALLILAALIRLAGMSKADLVGDDLAIIICVVAIGVGAAFAAPSRPSRPSRKQNQ
jgi:hypothetical protein